MADDEVLSNDEMNALLKDFDSKTNVDSEEDSLDNKDKKIKIYDFERPDKFSKDQTRTLQMIHETFARLSTTSFSSLLRTFVSFTVTSVDQLTYEEFLRSLSNPTTLGIINMDPLKGGIIFEIEPSLTFAIIERLLGGVGNIYSNGRGLTDIEVSVVTSIMHGIMDNLRESWENIIDLRPRLKVVETNPQFAQVVPPNDMVVLITIDSKIGNVEGTFNICIPYIVLEPIVSKLTAQYWYSNISKGNTNENFNIISNSLSNVKLDILAEIGTVDVKISDIISLEKDDIIKLNNVKKDSDITLKIGNKNKFKCKVGVINNRVCVKIIDSFK